MGKYIVELKKNETLYKAATRESDGTAYVCSAIGTPYTEPEPHAEVTADAYQRGYEAGLNDAWDAARKICTNWVLPDSVLSKIFEIDKTIDDIMKENTASEAIEKIQAYEQEKEEQKQIQVGDEVKCIRAGWTAIVTKIKEDRYLTLMGNDGTIADGYDEEDFIKTGRCFPEIAEVLAKMKETNNG